jgi:anti-sigma regulatory factor (Ser/Thr protein kinase)
VEVSAGGAHARPGSLVLAVTEPSQVGEARRRIATFAELAALGAAHAGALAIMATELATNLVKHGGGGQLAVARFADADGEGVELMALDRGAGIADVERAMGDGYSTAGSPGTGLGAIARQAGQLHVFSRRGEGSVILARLFTGPAAAGARTRLGAVRLPYPGETECGDDWCFAETRAGPTLLLADGSGHGAAAAAAAAAAIASFREHAQEDCVRIVERLHDALAATRGAAVAVARIDMESELVRLVGVGNISAVRLGPTSQRHMVSHNGTAGHTAPRIRELTYPYTPGDTVLLHSDGIGTRWTMESYPGLAVRHPGLIAGVLLRDHRRGRDDASVVAMRVPA